MKEAKGEPRTKRTAGVELRRTVLFFVFAKGEDRGRLGMVFPFFGGGEVLEEKKKRIEKA